MTRAEAVLLQPSEHCYAWFWGRRSLPATWRYRSQPAFPNRSGFIHLGKE